MFRIEEQAPAAGLLEPGQLRVEIRLLGIRDRPPERLVRDVDQEIRADQLGDDPDRHVGPIGRAVFDGIHRRLADRGLQALEAIGGQAKVCDGCGDSIHGDALGRARTRQLDVEQRPARRSGGHGRLGLGDHRRGTGPRQGDERDAGLRRREPAPGLRRTGGRPYGTQPIGPVPGRRGAGLRVGPVQGELAVLGAVRAAPLVVFGIFNAGSIGDIQERPRPRCAAAQLRPTWHGHGDRHGRELGSTSLGLIGSLLTAVLSALGHQRGAA